MTKKTDEKSRQYYVDLFALLVGGLCILVSTIQTAVGWNIAFDQMVLSIVFSVIVSSILVFLNFIIRDYKIKGNNLRLLLVSILYLFFTFFSFTGNFNSFYTNYKKENLYRIELEKSLGIIVNFQSTADRELKVSKEQLIDVVTRLKLELIQEIEDGEDGQRGWGQYCQQIADSLGYYIAKPNRPGVAQYDQMAILVGQAIDRNLEVEVDKMELKRIPLMQQVDTLTNEAVQMIEKALKEKDKDLYEKTYEDTKLIYLKMTNALQGATITEIQYDLIDFDATEIGKFHYTYKEALKDLEGENKMLVVGLGLASLIFDILVPFILLIFTVTEQKKVVAKPKDDWWNLRNNDNENENYK